VIVPDEQLSLAIGRRGQNVRLASQLTGWDIDILTEDEESQRRQEEFRTRSQLFIDALDVDDVLAHLLVTEGFTKIEDVAFVPIEDLTGIEGFDESLARELSARAKSFLEEQDRKFEDRRRELGVEDALGAIPGLTPAMLVTLGEAGIKTLDDLADLSSDELTNAEDGVLRTFQLDAEAANAIVMAARQHWFADDAAAPTAPAAAPAEPTAAEPPAEGD